MAVKRFCIEMKTEHILRLSMGTVIQSWSGGRTLFHLPLGSSVQGPPWGSCPCLPTTGLFSSSATYHQVALRARLVTHPPPTMAPQTPGMAPHRALLHSPLGVPSVSPGPRRLQKGPSPLLSVTDPSAQAPQVGTSPPWASRRRLSQLPSGELPLSSAQNSRRMSLFPKL